MVARTLHEPGLAISLHHGEFLSERRYAADGHEAIAHALAMLAALPELLPGDRLTVEHGAPEDLPAVSRASHYS